MNLILNYIALTSPEHSRDYWRKSEQSKLQFWKTQNFPLQLQKALPAMKAIRSTVF